MAIRRGKASAAKAATRQAKPEGIKDPRERAFNQAFGIRLRNYREGMNWSQPRMATFLGIGKDQYKKYEYGTRSFPLYLMPLLREISDRAYSDWLLGLNTPQRISPAKPTP